MDVRPDPPPSPRPRLGRIETLALASGLFVFSSIVVCQQEVVTDPVDAASTLVRLRSPWAEGHEAGRPVLHCSLNGVDVQPPSAVWIVGNRGLVLHSRNDGHTWTRVTLRTAAPPPFVARGASVRPGRGGSMRLAVAYEKAPPSPSAAPPKAPPTLPPEPQAQTQDTTPAGPEDLVGVHFSRDGKTRRGWIVSRSGRVHVTEDDGATWVEAGRVEGRAYAAGFGGGGFELIDSEGGRALLAPLFGASLVGDTLWIAGEDGRVVRRRRPFEGDDLRLATGGEPLLAAFFRDEDNGWAVGRRGRIVAVDARERRFEAQATPTLADLHAVSFMPGGRRGWAVGAQGTILDTQDGGQHWRASSVPATEEPRPWS